LPLSLAAPPRELPPPAECEYHENSGRYRFWRNAMKLAQCGLMILLAAPFAIAPASMAAARQSSQSGQASQADQSASASSSQTQTTSAGDQQSQADPLAAAARRARERQKEQPKPAKVWDNDNIPSSGQVSVVGNSAQSAPAAVSGSAAGENTGESQKTSAPSTTKKSDLEAQLKSAKDDLKNLQSSLDFAQRKLALDQQSYYQKPDYASDTAGAQALKVEQSQIDAKKQQVDAAQKKVDDLEAQVQSAGGATDSAASGNPSNSGKSDNGSAH
jgi:hypothetical protein